MLHLQSSGSEGPTVTCYRASPRRKRADRTRAPSPASGFVLLPIAAVHLAGLNIFVPRSRCRLTEAVADPEYPGRCPHVPHKRAPLLHQPMEHQYPEPVPFSPIGVSIRPACRRWGLQHRRLGVCVECQASRIRDTSSPVSASLTSKAIPRLRHSRSSSIVTIWLWRCRRAGNLRTS